MTTLAEVRLWGRTIGAVSLEDDCDTAAFQYTPEFAGSGIEASPITMPLGDSIYPFSGAYTEFISRLARFVSRSLPDKFGKALIDAWLATQGRAPDSFNSVERLCYTGSRRTKLFGQSTFGFRMIRSRWSLGVVTNRRVNFQAFFFILKQNIAVRFG